MGSINNTISQSVDASVLVDSDKGKESHCRMLLCTLKIRLFRVESKGFHIINLAIVTVLTISKFNFGKGGSKEDM